MTPTFDKIHSKFRLNGNFYDAEALQEVAYSLVKEGATYEKAMGDFLIDWMDSRDTVSVKTSGSTGAPKIMKVSKQAMVNSAIATGNYFKMKPGDTALHCLPSHYISGKMMLVRAMVLGLDMDFVEPSSQPIFDYDKSYDFCAMIPLQLQNTKSYIHHIKTLIIGGAAISDSLKNAVQNLKTKIYATYGMTETVSHIAVKRINGKEIMPYFKVFPKVKIAQDSRGCLVIDAPLLTPEPLITNDVVTIISASQFELLGRVDNVINSGGVKLFPEQIEAKLASAISQRFMISAIPDELLGQKLILVLEGINSEVDSKAFERLDKFEVPKEIYCLPKFVETATGKIQRSATFNLLKFNN